MSYIFVALGGVVVGIFAAMFLSVKNKTYGVIDIDHNTEQCRFRITSEELSDRRTKKAIFKVNHDAKISREEQIL